MSKVLEGSRATVFAGIDVSAATLAVAVQQEGRDGFRQKEFANSASGHKRLIAWLLQCGARARVSLEATTLWMWRWRWMRRRASESRC